MSNPPKIEQGLFGPIEPDKTARGQTIASSEAKIARVVRADGGDSSYDYAIPEELVDSLKLGQRIQVPFGKGNRWQIAFCVEFPETSQFEKLKYISSLIDEAPLMTDELLDLAKWISQYYCYPLGLVLSAIVPAAVKKQAGMVNIQYVTPTTKLTEWLTGITDQLTDDTTGKKMRISAKGKRALEYLKDNSAEPLEYKLNQLVHATNCGKPVFRTLGKYGLLEFVTRREMPSDDLINLQEQAEDELNELNPQGSSYDSSPIFDFDDEPSELELPDEPAFQLNDDQLNAVAAITDKIEISGFNAILLHGVTGSGKTEVYMECIQKVVDRGQQAIVLVPEIALTPQTERRFIERFGNVSVLHSGMTGVRRHQQWRQIAEGRANVIVGARSAVFAPVPDLGLIVVDEEHEGSYKQDQSPRYHGRDVAIKRAHQSNISIILGSATPSLETLTNCERRDEFSCVTLPRRVKDLPMPKVQIVDLKEEFKQGRKDNILSKRLENELRACIAAGKQAILLLNRRGHSNLLYCPSCQYVHNCPNCDVSLSVHRRKSAEQVLGRMLLCHHCLHTTKIPECCPVCQKKLITIGPGTQHAEDQINEQLKDLRLQRVDSDSMKPGDYRKVLSRFGSGEIDVLLGTQMIAKGLDFPNVSLVGILNADTALSVPDYRSSERTYQLISQVAGRCGRADNSGRVILQTFMPDEPAIAYAARHDFNGFARLEKQNRHMMDMPPYSRMARIIMSDPLIQTVEAESQKIRQILDQINDKLQTKMEIRGPMPAAIARLEKYHRFELIIKAPTPAPIQQTLAMLRQGTIENTACRIVIDVDPINMM